MPSITTQTIGTAASSDTTALSKAATQPKQADTVPTSAQVMQASQASSQQATVLAKSDKERAPQTPKKAEGGFSSQEERGSQKKKRAKDSKDPGTVDSVDIIA